MEPSPVGTAETLCVRALAFDLPLAQPCTGCPILRVFLRRVAAVGRHHGISDSMPRKLEIKNIDSIDPSPGGAAYDSPEPTLSAAEGT